jgi:ABC-type protease/lipase transport system fused ATPase/permease subunit
MKRNRKLYVFHFLISIVSVISILVLEICIYMNKLGIQRLIAKLKNNQFWYY